MTGNPRSTADPAAQQQIVRPRPVARDDLHAVVRVVARPERKTILEPGRGLYRHAGREPMVRAKPQSQDRARDVKLRSLEPLEQVDDG